MKKTDFVLIGQNNKYVEHVEQRGGITHILWTGNLELALKVKDPDAVIRKYGMQHITVENFDEQ